MLPHGLRFAVPVTAVQGLSTVAGYGTSGSNSVRSAYVSQANEQVAFDGSVSPVELEAATTYFYGVQPVAEKHSWIVNHFLARGSWWTMNPGPICGLVTYVAARYCSMNVLSVESRHDED
jgi:hypothetical protein